MKKHTMTERAIARMLVEPTGRHFLDSGGAYGRHWERNQGKTVDGLKEAPSATVTAFSNNDGYVTLDLFHYLTDKLEYRHDLTLGFQSFARAKNRKDDPWLSNMEEWVDRRMTYGDQDGSEYFSRWTFNSFNQENLLSQDIQGIAFYDPALSAPLVILQIHGGADIRGGYTEPKVFEITADDPHDLFNWASYTVTCTALGDTDQVIEDRATIGAQWQARRDAHRDAHPWADVHCWEHRGPGEWTHSSGLFVPDPWEGDRPRWQEGEVDGIRSAVADKMLCPECGAPCEVYAQ